MMNARHLSLALIASLIVNVFLVGGALTFLAIGARHARDHPPPLAAVRRAALSLPDAERGRFVAMLRDQGAPARPAIRHARDLRRRTWEAVGKPSFDADAAKADLARARALNESARGEIEDAVIDFAAALPADQRARFAAAMRPPARDPAKP